MYDTRGARKGSVSYGGVGTVHEGQRYAERGAECGLVATQIKGYGDEDRGMEEMENEGRGRGDGKRGGENRRKKILPPTSLKP